MPDNPAAPAAGALRCAPPPRGIRCPPRVLYGHVLPSSAISRITRQTVRSHHNADPALIAEIIRLPADGSGTYYEFMTSLQAIATRYGFGNPCSLSIAAMSHEDSRPGTGVVAM